MATADAGDFLPVVIHAADSRGLSAAERWQVLAQADGQTPAARRQDGRRRLVSALRSRAAATQADLAKQLRRAEAQGLVREIRQLWVVNAVACEATKAYLTQLASLDEVLEHVPPEGIRHSRPRPVFGGTGSPSRVLDVGWGVKKIGADQLMVSGTGVLIGVIDSGFELTHPDLAGRFWENPGEIGGNDGVDDEGDGYVDDLHGWNFADNDSVVDGTYPHGTYVSGVVAGTGVGSSENPNITPIRTGVAPGATLMALRVSPNQDLAAEEDVWEAMQYALAMGVHIVNMSLEWQADATVSSAEWREAVDVLTDGGVLVVTIAGNENDGWPNTVTGGVFGPPESITIPGRVPQALTVGATHDTDELWGDAPGGSAFDGSNTGPVTWQDVPGYGDYPYPPGLLKPDVVAPGVEIETTAGNFILATYLYSVQSGTSFAAPHAAGLAALLLEKDPNLGPYELRYLLQESALDLGPSGPDAAFGWGRIDALAANATTISPTSFDLSITPTNALWTTADIWVDNDGDGLEDTPIANRVNRLYATVRNVGGQVAGNVQLAFYYADVSTIGIGGFDPNGDGDPSDGNFTYIGTYAVPALGPSGSDHAVATGVVNWNIPTPTGDHWCVGVAAFAPPPNLSESNLSNNLAFRNFFELVVQTSASLTFKIEPPPEERRRGERPGPFELEVALHGVPREVQLYLVFPGEQDFQVEGPARKLTRARPKDASALLPKETYYALGGERIRFRDVRLPVGGALRSRLAVHLPSGVRLPPDARVVIQTLDRSGRPVGGLTVALIEPRAGHRPGPYGREVR
jgi:hypothetical protein